MLGGRNEALSSVCIRTEGCDTSDRCLGKESGGHPAGRCEMPRRAKTWHGLGSWILGGLVLTRCYAIAIGAYMRRPGVNVTKQVLLSSAQQSKGPDAFICFSKDLIDRTMYSVEQCRRIRSLIAQRHIAHDRSGSTYLEI
jgi:hypothetical protein